MNKKVIVTGGAGFIGSHLTEKLLESGSEVLVIDNYDPFYPKERKLKNQATALAHQNYSHLELSISEDNFVQKVVESGLAEGATAIVHLAAKAGVRPSIEDPIGYQKTNVEGTQNMLELAKALDIKQFVFASSSSVYGVNPSVPWSEEHAVLKPISPYASTKVSGELLGHVYSHLYDIRFIGLRFFTVYGPRQRPDLAIHKFARLILDEKPIPFFGDGSTRRDYTYVQDTVSGILNAIEYTDSQYELINLGNNQTVSLQELVSELENALGKKAVLKRLPNQPGDVPQTWANIAKAQSLLNYAPSTSLSQGLVKFREWLAEADK